MKKYQFLLLDAGPIIKLFELGIWDDFIEKCDVAIARTVAEDEALFADKGDEKEYIDYGLKPWEEKKLIKIIEMEPSEVKAFLERYDLSDRYDIHAGELESLAFLSKCSENWKLCSADQVVFRVLGFLGRSDQGISLEEVLQKVGLSLTNQEWKYTKRFREKYTKMGQVDAVQNQRF